MILIRSIQEKSYKNVNVGFNILVLHLMLLMMGRKIKSNDEGQEQVVDTQDTWIVIEMEDLPVICIYSYTQQQGYNTTTFNPLQETNTRQKDVYMVLIREMLLKRNYLK